MSIYRFIVPALRAALLAGGDLPEYWAKNPRADYIRRVVLSAPPWCDRQRVRDMMREAQFRSRVFGVPHVLGHIYPVTSDWVCGLTVPANLRVMTKQENDAMGNKFHVALQIGLFDAPEQLALI